MTWKIELTRQAQKDAKKAISAGIKQKIEILIELLQEDPFKPYPWFEPLRGNYIGCYSRRIDFQHRLVYAVDEESKIVTIISMFGHY